MRPRRPEALAGQRSRNAPLAHVAAGHCPPSPGVKGLLAPPGPYSAEGSPATGTALVGQEGP